MLQQTRVAAVIPYYRRFLRRFPTVRALARARESEVLRHWAGLGYYSRARNLHRAAKEIVRRHGGRFPRAHDAVLALPGVGRYTAAAVLSIAYGEPLAVLDGNVARVIARLDAIRGDLRAPRRWKELERRAQERLPCEAPGEWNQAMMELGARVCTPRAPRCDACPIARVCRARALGVQDEIPAPRRKRATERIILAAAVLLDARGRTLLVRRDGGLFSGMWQFPAVEVRRDAHKALPTDLLQSTQRTQRHPGKRITRIAAVKHSVTFRDITLLPFLVRVARLPSANGARTPRLGEIERLPVSSATRKIAAVVRQHLVAVGSQRSTVSSR
jgi:A/G-specific adenine glycosylase